MDPILARIVDDDTPKLNPYLANGIACEHLKYAEEYIHDIIKSVSRGFPEGLEYLGLKRISPYEEYDETRRKVGKSNRKVFDLAPSHIYMVRLMFRFKGEEVGLHRHIYLPFVGDGGSITLGGSRFNISPVLADKVISVGVSNIFVRLLRDRLTFERLTQHFQINGRRETVQIPWGAIYHKNQKMKSIKPLVKAECMLAHYLFAKYGFEKTFEMFTNTKPIVGGQEINANTYNEEEWAICTTNGLAPRGVGRGFWKASNIHIAIRKEELTPMVKSLIAGFFYVADHFPSQLKAEWVNDVRHWKILMGQIIFSGVLHHGKLHDDIDDHIQSLDEYVDNFIIQKLKKLKRLRTEVTDIWQLFAVVIENYNDWLLNATDEVNTMYDKELSVLYYVLYEITSNIFKLYFKLKAASKKQLTINEVRVAFTATLKPGLIYSIRRGHGEVTTISSSGDNKAFKITSIVTPQSGSTKQNSKKDRTALSDPSKRLHSSVAAIGGYLFLPKSDPSGRARLNLAQKLENLENVIRDPAHTEDLNEVQELLSDKQKLIKRKRV